MPLARRSAKIVVGKRRYVCEARDRLRQRGYAGPAPLRPGDVEGDRHPVPFRIHHGAPTIFDCSSKPLGHRKYCDISNCDSIFSISEVHFPGCSLRWKKNCARHQCISPMGIVALTPASRKIRIRRKGTPGQLGRPSVSTKKSCSRPCRSRQSFPRKTKEPPCVTRSDNTEIDNRMMNALANHSTKKV